MILDSSAIVAILIGEDDGTEFSNRIARSSDCKISAVNFMETAIVLDAKRAPVTSQSLEDYIQKAGVEVVAASLEHARIARQAYRDYGKGSGHRARLNFGDCFAYALAKASGEPLLFKGNDFVHTDVASARD
jgi:ribonuclease VapC